LNFDTGRFDSILRRVPATVAQPISAMTRYCAVFGHPVKHSASPAMQNAGITTLGLNWCYLAYDVHPENLRAAIDGAKVMKFIGLNLTVPHKLLALDMVDELDESAKTWGAVNTIRFEARHPNKGWMPLDHFAAEDAGEIRSRGFNTDAEAIVRSLREDLSIEVRGASVLLLGAGGAGRVAALKLAADGVKNLFLVNRTAATAKALELEIQQRSPEVRVQVGYPDTSVDLILNATSLGLRETDASPLDATQFPFSKAAAAYDMIYRPAETPFLKSAKASGCRVANGLGMLLYQGAKALELWSGRTAPIEIMRQALERNVYGRL
jgi:shikimate dehydrogenase